MGNHDQERAFFVALASSWDKTVDPVRMVLPVTCYSQLSQPEWPIFAELGLVKAVRLTAVCSPKSGAIDQALGLMG